MIVKIKLAAYAVLLILVIWFGFRFYAHYSASTQPEADPATNAVAALPETVEVTNAPVSTNASAPLTNSVAASTNVTETNLTALTNQTVAASNAVAESSNQVAVAANPPPASVAPKSPSRKGSQGAMIGSLALLIGAIIGLGLLMAHDVSQYMGNKTVELLFNDEGEGQRDPEYEKAEQVWANGKPLEAIQMMRDHLKAHPREQFVALRIAEIYEKDLKNYLAATLEYEEVLKHKFEAQRWGWAAIHLCNLYSKTNQETKTLVLLERIAMEYPQTGAAKKARNRLGWPEPGESGMATAPGSEARLMESDSDESAPPPPAPEPEKPKSNLPPGFRPKK
jgi:TolA-binding protein